MKARNRVVCVLAGILLILGITLAGCGGNAAVPTEKIANAERAIAGARDSNAIVNAPLDLRLAEDKLSEAKVAVAKEENDRAGRLADQAIIDADVARAKTRTAKAKQIKGEMTESIDALRKEIERKQK